MIPLFHQKKHHLNQDIQNHTNPDLAEAENVAEMPLPQVKLNFKNVTGSEIRQSRIVR